MAIADDRRRESESRAALAAEIRHGFRSRPGCSAAPCCSGSRSAIASPYFLTTGNVFNIMRQVSIDAIVAYGELFTIITAGIDLSVGSVLGFTGVAFAMLLANGMNVVARRSADARARPCDRARQRAGRRQAGHSGLHRHARRTAGLPRPHHARLRRHDRRRDCRIRSGTSPTPRSSASRRCSSSCSSSPAASQFLLGATRLGRYMYALGSNIEAARRVGVNVTSVTLAAYGLASVFATVGGMLLVARLTMGNPNAGMGAELQAIAAAVVGGASLFGGRGHDRRLLHRRDPVHHHRQRRQPAWREFVLADGDRRPAHRRGGLSRQRAEAARAGTVAIAAVSLERHATGARRGGRKPRGRWTARGLAAGAPAFRLSRWEK